MIYKAAQIDKYLKKPEPNIKGFLVYGGNEGLVAEYVRKLILTVSKDLYDPFAVVYLNGADVNSDPGLMISEYNSQSLMGGRRVIIIKDADNNLTKHLAAMLDNSSSDTLLVISSASLNKKSSLVGLAEKREDLAAIACYEDRDEDIFSTARAKFIEAGITIGNEALQLFCARMSNDRKTNLSELEKFITYIGDKKNATIDDVKAVVADQSSSSSEDVCFFAAGGYSQKAQAALQKMLNEGEEPVSITRSLTYHFYRILNCLAFMEKGDSADKSVEKLVPKVMFYRLSSFKRQLAIWPKDRVFSVLELLYKCEKDCKTTNMPAPEILSYAILQIASAAAKLAQR